MNDDRGGVHYSVSDASFKTMAEVAVSFLSFLSHAVDLAVKDAADARLARAVADREQREMEHLRMREEQMRMREEREREERERQRDHEERMAALRQPAGDLD